MWTFQKRDLWQILSFILFTVPVMASHQYQHTCACHPLLHHHFQVFGMPYFFICRTKSLDWMILKRVFSSPTKLCFAFYTISVVIVLLRKKTISMWIYFLHNWREVYVEKNVDHSTLCYLLRSSLGVCLPFPSENLPEAYLIVFPPRNKKKREENELLTSQLSSFFTACGLTWKDV